MGEEREVIPQKLGQNEISWTQPKRGKTQSGEVGLFKMPKTPKV